MILSENLDENSFCTVVETQEILEQVEVKKESENKYMQNEDRLGRDLFVIKKCLLNNFFWEFYYNQKRRGLKHRKERERIDPHSDLRR